MDSLAKPKNFAEFRNREEILDEKRRILFWKLIGQAQVAFPDEVANIWAKHVSRLTGGVDAALLVRGTWGRIQADVVEECAKKFPGLAFTHC